MVLYFCPACGGLLSVQMGREVQRLECRTCPYIHNILERGFFSLNHRLKFLHERYVRHEGWALFDTAKYVRKFRLQFCHFGHFLRMSPAPLKLEFTYPPL